RFARGADQIQDAFGQSEPEEGRVWSALEGAGNTALGGYQYLASPVDAALRTIVGKPLEENFGIPHQYSELAAAAGAAAPVFALSRLLLGRKPEALARTIGEALSQAEKRARQLAVNRATGKRFERETQQALEPSLGRLSPEVTLRTKSG